MKLRKIKTVLVLIASFPILFSSLEINCVGINTSPNKELLEAEIIENKMKRIREEEVTFNDENTYDKEIEAEKDDKVKSLGNFKLTAYCSCKKCCGKYAKNRPVDENGNEIVYGSIGRVLTQGESIAVDPNVIPYDTKVVINGHEYIAHDTGGAIKENKIDIYFENHQDAVDFGVKYEEVFVYTD